MKISCNVIRDLLPLYYENIASNATRDLVEGHCKECPECAARLKEMGEGEIVILDNGNGLKQFVKDCKKNFNGLLAAFCYMLLFIFGMANGLLLSDPTDGAGAIIIYQFFLLPVVGIFASMAVAKQDFKIKYIFPVVCGLADASYQYLLVGIKSGRLAEMDIVDYVNIYTFLPAFILAMIGFIIGLATKNKAKKRLGFFNEGMYAGIVVVVVAVLFAMYQPPAIKACIVFGGAGFVVLVISFVLRRMAINKIKNEK